MTVLMDWLCDALRRPEGRARGTLLKDDELRGGFEQERARMSAQSVICSKDQFESAAAARKWVSEHGFITDKTDETQTSFRFRQFPPSECEEGSFRNHEVDDGVSLVLCQRKSQEDKTPLLDMRLSPRIQRINRCALQRLSPDDVHVAGMNICNNVIDYYHSRFSERALRQVARLVPDTPMSIGHHIDWLPVGRAFDADVLMNDSEGARLRELRDVNKASWVRGLWYWSRHQDGASDLRARIDAGIVKEVSAHWFFERATCSECKTRDIRDPECEHVPGEKYDDRRCFYEMDDVTEYVETGLVVRGGQIGTSIWSAGSEQAAAARLPFGDAIREIKQDRGLFGEWGQRWRQAAERSNGSAREWLAEAVRAGRG